MVELGSIQYSKSFIDQVICRIDFNQFIENDNVFCPEIEKCILSYFPSRGKEQIIRFNAIKFAFSVANKKYLNSTGDSIDGVQREYFSQDGKNKVIMSNQFLVFDIRQYDSFVAMSMIMREIISVFLAKNHVGSERVGIRYINIYDEDKIKLQKNYFSSEIASILPTKNTPDLDGMTLIRSMHMNEYQVSSMRLNFRYGMYNPEYPNALMKKNFSLDFDCFSDEVLESSEEIMHRFEIGHDAIQRLFENAISDYMRKVMSNE